MIKVGRVCVCVCKKGVGVLVTKGKAGIRLTGRENKKN